MPGEIEFAVDCGNARRLRATLGRVAQEPAVPVSDAEARRLTGALRESVEQVRSAVLVLTERVRAAYRRRVWVALGYPSWGAYAAGELEVSRSTAYRLLDLAAAAEAIEDVAGRDAEEVLHVLAEEIGAAAPRNYSRAAGTR